MRYVTIAELSQNQTKIIILTEIDII